MRYRKPTTIAMFAACWAISANAALPTAPVKNGVPAATVQIRDLDLATRRGRIQLKMRVASAVEAVCGSYDGAAPEDQDVIGDCRRNVIADISPRVVKMIAHSGGQLVTNDVSRL